MKQARLVLSAAFLVLLSLLTLILITPSASAASADDVSPALTPAGKTEPLALATTGLNITAPVVIGITMLVIGMVIVAWAFLRTGSRKSQH